MRLAGDIITIMEPDLNGNAETGKNLEVLLEQDPRDFIAVTAFQKKGREIDPNPDNRWEQTPLNRSYIKQGNVEVVTSDIFDKTDQQAKLLLAVKMGDQVISMNTGKLDYDRRGLVQDILKSSLRYLKDVSIDQ
jgi:hypothetical protein